MVTASLQQRTERGIKSCYDAWYPVSTDEAVAAAEDGTPPPIEPYERFSCEVGCAVTGPSVSAEAASSSRSSF